MKNNTENSNGYIYGLISPFTQMVFYVGYTLRNPCKRLMEHIRDARNPKCSQSLSKRKVLIYLDRVKAQPILEIFETINFGKSITSMTNEEYEFAHHVMYEYEKCWIQSLRLHGIWLTNSDDGGCGGQNKLKVFEVMSPDHKLVRGCGIGNFCQEHNLDRNWFSKVLDGKKKIYRGWYNVKDKANPPKYYPNWGYQQKGGFSFIYYKDMDVIHQTDNLQEFCNYYGLDHGSMSKVASGSLRQFRGWFNAKTPKEQIKYKKPILNGTQFLSPNNVVYNVTNVTAFCREMGLNQGAMSAIARGEYKSYKGWTLYDDPNP